MKFIIDNINEIENKTLIYDVEEFSFYTEPHINKINFDVVLNKLNLTASGIDNKIIQVSGFCGYKEWIESNYEVPKSRRGVLKILESLPAGLGSYPIYDENVSTYVNLKSGWVCVGNPEKKETAVEFIPNCIAVIDENKNFVSLWLKPQLLPSIR